MLGMATFSFYNEIQISECPPSFYELKQKIKELYILDEKQINETIISYQDSDAQHHYISNDDEYEQAIPKIESIILTIEILDEDKYLTIDPSFEEEYNNIYLLDLDDNNKTNGESNEISEKMEVLSIDKEECTPEEGNEQKEEKDKEEKEIVHNGIKCNICGKENIEGIRYLCGVCDNFNLCQECEKINGEGHNHPLLKIRDPQYTPLFFKCELSNEDEQQKYFI